jgi:hypothetical protein
MKTFLAGVVTTVVVLFVYLFVFRVPVGFPQVIDCRYTGAPQQFGWRSGLLASTESS